MTDHLVSVITPCYNAADYIADTIESVLAQTYRNWEMIIIDDCSSDKSSEIILSYAEKDGRIHYLKTDSPSGSPSRPRNIGLEHAKGEYIAMLDSDDIWLPSKLEEQLDFISNNGYDFVYSCYEKISHDGVRSGRTIRTKGSADYQDLLKSDEIPCLTALLRSDVIGDARFVHEEKEDYIFWLGILKKGITAHNTGIVHALYRLSKNSRSSDKVKMFKSQWNVIHNIEGVNFFKATYCMAIYAFKGIAKRLR